MMKTERTLKMLDDVKHHMHEVDDEIKARGDAGANVADCKNLFDEYETIKSAYDFVYKIVMVPDRNDPNAPEILQLIGEYAREDAKKYLRYCTEGLRLSVKLSAEEQAAILQAYDQGAENTDRQLLQSVIAKLKDEIWA